MERWSLEVPGLRATSSSNIAEPLIAPGIEFHWFSLDYMPNAEPIIGVRGMGFFDWPG